MERIAAWFRGGVPWETLGVALLLLIGCILAGRILLRTLARLLERSRLERGLSRFVQQAARVIVWLITVMIVGDSLGVPVTSLVALFSVAGLAVSLAVQSSLSNLAGGLMVMTNKPFSADDYIEVSGMGGTVREVTLFYTKLLTDDGKEIFVPNSEIAGAKIVNFTRSPRRRVDIDFSVGYGVAFERVRQCVLPLARQMDRVLDDPAPALVTVRYGPSAVDYSLRVYAATADYGAVRAALMERVRPALEGAGISLGNG